jgi:isoprenylcysteine carboxyl methyltransferase (ICMT) family protein YpbQ
MFKDSIRFPLIFFVVSTIWQLIAKKEVNWIDNLGVCFIMFVIFLLYNWAKVPYKWKKGNDE